MKKYEKVTDEEKVGRKIDNLCEKLSWCTKINKNGWIFKSDGKFRKSWTMVNEITENIKEIEVRREMQWTKKDKKI